MAGAKKLLGRGASLDTRLAGLEQAVAGARGRLDDAAGRPGRARRRPGRRPAAALGRPHRGRARRRHRLRQVVDVQRAHRSRARRGRRTPARPRRTPPPASGARTRPPSCSTGSRSRRATRSSATRCSTRATSTRRSTDWCCSTCPTTTPPRSRTTSRSTGWSGSTDLLVWVLDPQKYADAAVHDRFLAPLASHRDVMLVVLNHIDEVAKDGREPMLADVRRLLDDDGLGDVPVLATSARTGEGIAELAPRIGKRVADKAATRTRLAGDIADAAARLAAAERGRPAARARRQGPARARRRARRRRRGPDRRRRRRAGHHAPRPPGHRLAADGLGLPAAPGPAAPPAPRPGHQRQGRDRGRADLDARGRLRAAGPRRDDRAVDCATTCPTGLTQPWVRAVRRASTSRLADLDDRLDRAVATTDLGVSGTPGWCRVVRGLQWLLLVAALAGAVWLGVAGRACPTSRCPTPSTPDYGGFPVPTLLLVGGVVAGMVLALLSRVLIAVGRAVASASSGRRRLRAAVPEVSEELVVEPVAAELAAYRATWEGLRTARALTGSRPQPVLTRRSSTARSTAASVVRRPPAGLART